MFKSMKKYMQVGIVHFMAYPSTIRGEFGVANAKRMLNLAWSKL